MAPTAGSFVLPVHWDSVSDSSQRLGRHRRDVLCWISPCLYGSNGAGYFYSLRPRPLLTILPGLASIVKTRGNLDTHVILRGGTRGPNYASEHVKEAAKAIYKKKEWASIMVDCSRTFGLIRAPLMLTILPRWQLAKKSQKPAARD